MAAFRTKAVTIKVSLKQPVPERNVFLKNMTGFYSQIYSIQVIFPVNESEVQVPSLMTDLNSSLI